MRIRGLRHDDGAAQFAVNRHERIEEPAAGMRVELGRGLVEEQQARAHRQSRREVQYLLLATRKLGGSAVHPIVDAHETDRFGHQATHILRRDARVFQAEGELRANGIAYHLGFGVLRDKANGRRPTFMGGYGLHAVLNERQSVDGDGAGYGASRRYLGFQQAQQRRLPAAGRPGHHAERSICHLPVHIVQRLHRCRPPVVGHMGKRQPAHINYRHSNRLLISNSGGMSINAIPGRHAPQLP